MNRVTIETRYNYKGIFLMIFSILIDFTIQYNIGSNIYLQTLFWGIILYTLRDVKFVTAVKVYNKNNVGLIITDPGEDIDDEIALFHLIDQTKKGNIKFSEIYIVFANGKANSKLTSKDRMLHFKKIFPEFTSNEVYIGSTNFILLTTDCLKYINGNHFDVFLQIAPLCGINPNFFKQNSIDTRIIMGDYNDPNNSLNLKKSWKNDLTLDLEFVEQEEAMKLCNVKYITPALAKNVPLKFNNISNLPDDIYKVIIDKAFKMFVGRAPHTSTNCMNVTVNSNLKTAINYLGNDYKKLIDKFVENLNPNNKKYINDSCYEFIEKMTTCDDQNKMFEALKTISCCVQMITKCEYKDSDFSAESLDNIELAKENFINYIEKNKCDTTPAYDLIAMVLFMRPDINGKRFDVNSTCFFKYRLMDY